MYDKLIGLAVTHRWLVIIITIAISIAGIANYQLLPIDAVPDITNVQVQLNTEAPGYTPLEVETRITFPIENAVSGIPNLEWSRSLSRYGLSQVTLIFKDGTDIYFARQLISERLQIVRDKLPQGVTPQMGPLSTGLGEIFMYTVENDKSDRHTPSELRTAQDWIVKPQLKSLAGVADVNSIGGFEKQFHITPRIESLLSHGLTLKNLLEAITDNSANVGAGYIERNGEQYLVRSPGQLASLHEIENLPLSNAQGATVLLREVAQVGLGQELRTGAATENGREVVLGTVFMLIGENSRIVSQSVANKLEEINRSLPQGMIAKAVYDRTRLVDRTIQTVKRNLFEGALLVIAILFSFLGNIRAALITAMVIPLTMLFTVSGMVASKISANLMSLGALDFGLIVDGSVIIVENCMRRLAEEQQRLGRMLTLNERLSCVKDASREVRQATMFGELIIMLVYLPIFALSGVEGKMFHPMAITVVIALFGAMILSLSFVPAAVAIFSNRRVRETDSRLITAAKALYEKALIYILAHPLRIIGMALVIVTSSLSLSYKLGSEFMPGLDEGDIALHALRIPGTSLTQAIEMQQALEERIRRFPEVSHTFTKIGTAEIATDPMPPSVADGYIILKDRGEWPDPKRSKLDLLTELEAALADIPGNNYEFTQPIQMRFNELIAGVRSDIAVKVFGDDMDTLFSNAEEIERVLSKIDGAADVKVEQISGLPMLSINFSREKLFKAGINLRTAQEIVSSAIGGVSAGELYDGDRRFQIVVRLAEQQRTDLDALGSLPIPLPGPMYRSSAGNNSEQGGVTLAPFIPLSSVAELSIVRGPNQISRENTKRRVVVTANVRGRDLGGFVKEAQDKMRQIKLPPGYWVSWGGQFEQLISAKARLSLVIPIALLLIIVLLYYSFGSFRYALIVFSGVPLALSGGILALYLRGIPLSVSAAVGFIALSGVAVLNGLVMLSFINKLRSEHYALNEAILNGSLNRLRPVLMTALVASLGFVPMALASGPGAEVQRPIATVVIGGIVSSTILTLFVLPALYKIFSREPRAQARVK